MWKLWKRVEKTEDPSLETRIRQLEADFKSLELEWNDIYQKVRKALGRITKTEALESAKNEALNAPTLDPMLQRERILQLARQQRG